VDWQIVESTKFVGLTEISEYAVKIVFGPPPFGDLNQAQVENTNASPTKLVLFTVEPQLKAHVAYFGASARDSKQALRISVVPSPAGQKDALTLQIQLPSELSKGKTADVDVELVLTHYLSPFPSEILQKEKQLVKFSGSHYLFSPYKVTRQTTKILTGSKNIESYTKLKPSSQSESTVSLGPYENTAPFSLSELSVHYENNSPFLTITKLERTIELSHWGNIAVEERLEILHTGAKLKGSFSRFDYQREP
ncbi:Dolichyl-diphosphooligosaccharide--protein glycosyltransferase subunit 1, partial [Orchesella cincta]